MFIALRSLPQSANGTVGVAWRFVAFANRERITSRLFLNKMFLIFATEKSPKSHSSKTPLCPAGGDFRGNGAVDVIAAPGDPPHRRAATLVAPQSGELGTLI
jgi:hypothetical protein